MLYLRFILPFFLLFNFISVANANSNSTILVINASTGEIINQEQSLEQRYPASLTKLMTLYLAFSALEKGYFTADQSLVVSRRAALQPSSKLGLRQGEKIKVKEAIISLIVKSANDAAVVLAEALAGSEESFAVQMNLKASELNMQKSSFRNASGLHDDEQYTTARDMAKLALALKNHFPHYFPLFSVTEFYYKDRLYSTHNNMVLKYDMVNGIKTGYTRASGYNMITSAKKDGVELLAVILGESNANARDETMEKILKSAFLGSKLKNIIVEKLVEKSSYIQLTKLNIFNLPTPVAKPNRYDYALYQH
jgi:D-alanyl-D-alanine carboxypeptidase